MNLLRRSIVGITLWTVCGLLPLGAQPEVGPSPEVVDLDGDWSFSYQPEPAFTASSPQIPIVPQDREFTARMSVPAIWDDQMERLRAAPFWVSARFNPNYRRLEFPMGDGSRGLPDASLPYLLGVGWYRTALRLPRDWKPGLLTLQVGGVRLEAWIWLNGIFIGHHLGHSTPFQMRLDEALQSGGPNVLTIAVANTRAAPKGAEHWYLGSAVQGYQGRSGGIYRPVSLYFTGPARIASCYLHAVRNGQRLLWNVEVERKKTAGNLTLRWAIRDPDSRQVLGAGHTTAGQDLNLWQTDLFRMRPWSDHDPKLYQVEVSLWDNGNLLDRREQAYGLRRLERDGTRLRLNGRFVMLRGTTDHYYFPLTTTAPGDASFYRNRIRKLKELGFNWIRFHTWVPSEEYMKAADELGMMLQVEPPTGFQEQEWIDILKSCRKHPSVVIYCPGNEETLDDDKINVLRRLAALALDYVPDALFNPQEAMRGVEYAFQLAPGEMVQEPFPHNPRRLAALRQFSDLFGAYLLGYVSYSSVKGDWRDFDRRLAIYQRPILTHELGIHGNYLNLDLEHRYAGTRIGNELFDAVRRYLAKMNLLDRSWLYYRNSCAWMRILRKHAVEMARKSKYIAGYDLLGAFDQDWHQSGYPVGIMNEFLELKPGESVADVLEYNGESVLLLDHSNRRNFHTGERLRMGLMASLYMRSVLREGTVRWRLIGDDGTIHRRGGWSVRDVANGTVQRLGTVDWTMPELSQPAKVALSVQLEGDEYDLANHWDFWVFPTSRPEVGIAADETIWARLGPHYAGLRPITMGERKGLRLVSNLDPDTMDFLARGGDALLLGSGPFPTLPTSFQMSQTGRVRGNLATIITDHPLMRRFPHDGYCDWQFYSMLEGASAVNFSELAVPFDPILEVASSFKLIFKQASLFEWRVGKGRLVVCTLNLDPSDAAAGYLLDSIVQYMQGAEFAPRTAVTPAQIERLIRSHSGPSRFLAFPSVALRRPNPFSAMWGDCPAKERYR